ncbi:MAG: HEPN domain-containing protein [Candidatus Omnitrophica bacterium]|nr:HEPN domain-containing protein [Candidatus Omnitrophota bacterium]
MEHSVALLARYCSEKDPTFTPFIKTGTAMDQYYIPTRYPDALADPAVPFESYSVTQAAEAVRLASEIVRAVKSGLQRE